VITRNPQAIETERELDPAQQIGHEKDAAMQDGDDREIAPGVVPSDLRGEFIEAAENGRFVEESV
jgi:hypothetical protein